jgi:2-polyprenyl-6-methoxyphenol hydroxylase-like FAD-dependent oxidoreductase
LIVGGGMAGLALAIALRQQGRAPELIERARAWPTSGAGLYLVGNGTRALHALGLAEALFADTSAASLLERFLAAQRDLRVARWTGRSPRLT